MFYKYEFDEEKLLLVEHFAGCFKFDWTYTKMFNVLICVKQIF